MSDQCWKLEVKEKRRESVRATDGRIKDVKPVLIKINYAPTAGFIT